MPETQQDELKLSNGLRIIFTGATDIDRYTVQRSINKENRRMKNKGSQRRVYAMKTTAV